MSVTKNNQSHFHFTNYCRCPCFFPDIPHSSIDTYFTKKVSFQAGPSCKVAHRSISRIDMHRKCRSPPIFEISHHPSSKVPGGTLTSLLPVQKVRAFNLYNHRHTHASNDGLRGDIEGREIEGGKEEQS